MRRFFASFTISDWFVLLGGLALVVALETGKRRDAPEPQTLAEETQRRPEAEPIATPAPPRPVEAPEPERAPKAPPTHTFLRPKAADDPRVALMMANPPATFDSPVEMRLSREMAEFPQPLQTFLTETFQKKRYFGSVALAPSGAFGWSADVSALRQAREVALAFCAQHGPGCEIVADLVPRGLPKVAPRQSLTFAQSMALKGVTAQTGPRAFARSLDGSFGLSRDSLPKIAEMKAISGCQAMQKSVPGIAPMPCEIIAIWLK